MENKPNFNIEPFEVTVLRSFTAVYLQGLNVADAYSNFLNTLYNNTPENQRKRKILERCRNLFKDPSMKKSVDNVITTYRAKVKATKGNDPTSKEIAGKLLEFFSDEILGNGKRRYNMSQIASEDMLSIITTPQGTLEKDVKYFSFEEEQNKKDNNNKNANNDKDDKPLPPSISLHNSRGDTIIIEYMGRLCYKTQSSDEYIFKLRIFKSIDSSGNSYKIYERFSNIDVTGTTNTLWQDPEYCKVVFSELLSTNNLEHSYADDYIGEINSPKKTDIPLKPGEEITLPGFYKYQITPNYALIYDGERIEAIRAYNQQEAKKEAEKKSVEKDIKQVGEQVKKTDRAGDEPEI